MSTPPPPSEGLRGWRLWWLVFSAGVVGGTVGCAVFVGLVLAAFMMGRIPD